MFGHEARRPCSCGHGKQLVFASCYIVMTCQCLLSLHGAYAILQWAGRRIGAILVTVNPAHHTNELVRHFEVSTRLDVLTLLSQIAMIGFVSVSHLFLVPQIRTSSYLTLFVESLPSLRKFSPGEIQEEACLT